MGNAETIEALLHEEEGSALDFKRDQYPFEIANDTQKAELLKDILAFANAWRRTDAYILIGVAEVRGGRSNIVGVSTHIEDANLQQFINAKINRPLSFSYSVIAIDGKQIGVIHIPIQRRPFFLKKCFGGLQASTVYIRRGSSTAVAMPDEIALMGHDSQTIFTRAPKLEPCFVFGNHDEIIEKTLKLNVISAQIPEKIEFPKYGLKYNDPMIGSYFGLDPSFRNQNFYYEYAEYIKAIKCVKAIRLAAKNRGNAVANDVKLVFKVCESVNDIILYHEVDLPEKPSPEKSPLIPYFPQYNVRHDIIIKKTPSCIVVTCELGKIQAMDLAVSSDMLFMGANRSLSLNCSAEIFSDELDSPINDVIQIDLTVDEKIYNVSDFIKNNNG